MPTKYGVTLSFKNICADPITNLTLSWHYSDDYHGTSSFQGPIQPDQLVADFNSAYYHAGLLTTGHMYWHITFTAGGTTFSNKTNFYCDLEEEDNGGTCVLSSSGSNFHVGPPKSSSCNCSVKKV